MLKFSDCGLFGLRGPVLYTIADVTSSNVRHTLVDMTTVVTNCVTSTLDESSTCSDDGPFNDTAETSANVYSTGPRPNSPQSEDFNKSSGKF